MNYELQRLQQLAKSNKSYKRAYLEYCRRYEGKTNIFLNTLHKRDLTNFEIVIAHYREPTKILNSWLEKYYRLGVKTTIYHKGGWGKDSYDFASDNIITLPNIGRESHTYLRHILDRWNNLAEWTFFAQADISDHWQKAEMLPLNYYLLGGKMENRNFTANLIHHRIGLDKRHERAMEEWWKTLQLSQEDIHSSNFKWAPGGFFSVHRDLIKRQGRDFYQRILDTLKENNPIEGHFCERSWFYIFNNLRTASASATAATGASATAATGASAAAATAAAT